MDAHAIAGLPCNAGLKAILIRGKAHARGLYACEVTPVPVNTLKAFAAACKGAFLHKHASMASMACTCTLHHTKDPDPEIAVAARRLVAARRIWWIMWNNRAVMQDVLYHHCHEQHAGTCDVVGLRGPGSPGTPLTSTSARSGP